MSEGILHPPPAPTTNTSSWHNFWRIQADFFIIYIPFVYHLGLESFVYIITTYFAGLIDDTHLAGVGLGCTVSNIVMVSSMYGYTSVFETYGSQIYSSHDRKYMGVLLIKTLLQGGIVFLFILGPYINVIHLLHFFAETSGNDDGGGDTVEGVAQQFILFSVGFGFFDYCVDIFNKYLITQEHYKIIYFTSTVYTTMHILANYLLVIVMHLKVRGLVVAMYIARGSNLLLLILYCMGSHSKGKLAWSGFSFHILHDWWSMMKLGLSGSLCLLTELGFIEVASFLTQFAGKVNLLVLVINLQVYVLLKSIIVAHCQTFAIQLGLELGRGDRTRVLAVSKIFIFKAVLFSTLFALTIWFARFQIVKSFTDNNEVIQLFGRVFWIAVVYSVLDYIGSMIARGLLVAYGKQNFAAIVSGVVCYLIGLPVIAYIIFRTDYGAKGVLLVFLGVFGLKAAVIIERVYFLNIDSEIRVAMNRLEKFQTTNSKEIKTCYRLFEANEKRNNTQENKGSNLDTQTIFSDSAKKSMLLKFILLLSAATLCTLVGIITVVI